MSGRLDKIRKNVTVGVSLASFLLICVDISLSIVTVRSLVDGPRLSRDVPRDNFGAHP